MLKSYLMENYGYITGISFVNQLGLTTQMPAVIEVVTNREVMLMMI